MAFTIAVSGKGGTGKSTIAGLIIRYLSQRIGKAVLAVDADPNSSLGLLLGIEVGQTVADIREDVLEKRMEISPGMSKERQIEYTLQQLVIESNRFDLLTMGRPEGPKCYCYVNHILRKYLDEVSGDYPYVVIDNEAGMEHLSRRTTNNVDLLLVIAEPTVVGISSAERIFSLTDELPILIKKRLFALNRIPAGGADENIERRMESLGILPAARFTYDEEIFSASASGKSLLDISDDNATYQAVGGLLENKVLRFNYK